MLSTVIDFFLHLDLHLAAGLQNYGLWLYLILFLVIFAETGLVVTPFLPGDSLLFAAGALCAMPESPLNVYYLGLTLIVAAIFGDATNFHIGQRFGSKVYQWQKSFFFNPAHIKTTEAFFAKYGSWTIVFARFAPIARTFAPFVAGVVRMNYRTFFRFNVLGGIVWIVVFLGAGAVFGNIPEVKKNFHVVIFAVIGLSVLPLFIGAIKSRMNRHIKTS
jgi:membrane-associated protein